MQRGDFFPIELLEPRAQLSILEEFDGRRPTISEVASISDVDLLKLSGFGPSTITKVRSITQERIPSSFVITTMSNEELLSERDRLLTNINELRGEFRRQEQELRQLLRSVRIELSMRGLS